MPVFLYFQISLHSAFLITIREAQRLEINKSNLLSSGFGKDQGRACELGSVCNTVSII